MAQGSTLLQAPAGTWANAAAANGDILTVANNTLYRLNAAGGLQWARSYTGFERIRSILEMGNGEIIVAGSILNGPTRSMGIMRTTALGEVVWARTLPTETVLPDQGGQPYFWSILRRAGADDFVLYYECYSLSRRLSRFTGVGDVAWSRVYATGNSIQAIAVDDTHSKLFVVDVSDVYRFDLADGHPIWHSGFGAIGGVVTIACNGGRLGVGYVSSAKPAIAVLDTAGHLLGAMQWNPDLLTVYNDRIVACGNGFAMASGVLSAGSSQGLVFTVDAGLTSGSAFALPNNYQQDASAWAGGILLSGPGMLERVDLSSADPCITALPVAHVDPGLSQTTTSTCTYTPSALTLGGPSITVAPGTGTFPSVCLSNAVRLAARVILDGPYNSSTGLMNDGLRGLATFPLTEPYTAAGFTQVGGGGETIPASVLTTTGNNAIVDWVLVELRAKTNNASIVRTKAALLQRDGDIVDLDGTSALTIAMPPDDYFIAIRHRDHLGVMTLAAVTLNSSATTVDLTNGSRATFGTNAQRIVGAVRTNWCGNTIRDGLVKYTGGGNDRDPILARIGGSIPTATVVGYYKEDVNLDGTVKYTGSNNDRDPILVTVGGSIPTAVRAEQLP